MDRKLEQAGASRSSRSLGRTQFILREFPEQNPGVRFHFTPTYCSWLSQVELWLAKIEREVVPRCLHFGR
jgi:transposase